MLRGNLDRADLRQVSGWARDETSPDTPVSLLVTDNDRLIGRVLANRHRADLEKAGFGSGRHAFEFQFPQSLAPFERHVIRVRRESDGADLGRSPLTLEPARDFNAFARDTLNELIQRSGTDEDLPAKIDFLVGQVDLLLQRLAERDGKRAERRLYRTFLQRWRRAPDAGDAPSRTSGAAAPRAHHRALVIDERLPRSDRDAGSIAIISHIQSLQRLGYEVAFAAAADFAVANANESALAALGVTCCRAPYYGSVEEVLRRQAGEFDVVYLHRVASAIRYGELARHYNPRARRIYSVADLHHLRVARQAEAEQRPELLARSRRLQFAEFVAAASADAVITHSPREAETLLRQIPACDVHTVRWAVALRPTPVSFRERRGVAFIGGYGHEPNVDAARWLIADIMPRVRRSNPAIECLLVGSNMPDHLRQLCGEGVVAVGHVSELADIFGRVRLTAAPLTYGAGIKGKVVESLAAGVPCVCTPVAAEGLDLPGALQACVADNADRLAALICDLHDNEGANAAAARAGGDYVAVAFSAESLDAAMRRALGRAAPNAAARAASQIADATSPGG